MGRMVWVRKKRTYLASADPAEGDLEENEKRDLSVDDELPRQGTADRRLGHRQRGTFASLGATGKAASMPHTQPLLSGSAANANAPGKKTVMLAGQRVSALEERGKSEIKAAWKRERQRDREGTGEPDRIWLHQWDQRLLSVRTGDLPNQSNTPPTWKSQP
ncbi:hypothetical protein HispidOSU_019494 [Sigmodon hispidus]